MMAVNFSDFIGLVYVGRLEMSRYSIYSTGSKCENDKTWEIIQHNPGERERERERETLDSLRKLEL